MRAACWLLVGLLGLGGVSRVQADAAEGLTWPQWLGGLRLEMSVQAGTADPAGSAGRLATLSGTSLLGDYYFGRYSLREGDASGFRATTGLFLGSRLGPWSGQTPAALSGSLLSVERQSFSLLAPPPHADAAGPDAGTVPYLGLGYSGNSMQSGWGFNADLGLMALNPGSAVRLGRVFGGGQTLDDAVRELRLSPLVQLGVARSF
jgi:hypothetical protein